MRHDKQHALSVSTRIMPLCQQGKFNTKLKLRVIDCQAQVKKFDFFFRLYLHHLLFVHNENFSKILQKSKMSAVSGQRLENLAMETLKNIRSDESSNSFCSFQSRLFFKKRENHTYEKIEEQSLPQRK